MQPTSHDAVAYSAVAPNPISDDAPPSDKQEEQAHEQEQEQEHFEREQALKVLTDRERLLVPW